MICLCRENATNMIFNLAFIPTPKTSFASTVQYYCQGLAVFCDLIRKAASQNHDYSRKKVYDEF